LGRLVDELNDITGNGIPGLAKSLPVTVDRKPIAPVRLLDGQ